MYFICIVCILLSAANGVINDDDDDDRLVQRTGFIVNRSQY